MLELPPFKSQSLIEGGLTVRNISTKVRRLLLCTPAGMALFCVSVAGSANATQKAQIVKEMPMKGSVRQGEVVYVDDGSCPVGEIRKITGGNQSTGVSRKVECVKRPDSLQE